MEKQEIREKQVKKEREEEFPFNFLISPYYKEEYRATMLDLKPF